jgi:phosphoglycolate phosphatase
MFEYDIYEGVAETLSHLTASGMRVAVATAKAHEYAREVIDASVLRNSIHHVYGSELDGTNVEKRDLLRHILAVEGTPVHDVIMIGDRHHDIDGARANGVANIGVDSAAAITSAIAELEAPSR